MVTIPPGSTILVIAPANACGGRIAHADWYGVTMRRAPSEDNESSPCARVGSDATRAGSALACISSIGEV